MKEENKNFTFLWRENYIDYLWAKNIIASTYFQKEGILIYEYSQLTAYATSKELDTAKGIGRTLFIEDRYKNIYKEFAEISKETGLKREQYSEQNLRHESSKELFRLYEELFDLMKRFLDNYRYTEPYYLTFLEDELDRFLKEHEPHRKEREYLKAQLLSGTDAALSLSPEIKSLIRFLHETSKKRFAAKRSSITASRYADALLNETARRFYLAATQVSSLNLEELKGLLLDNEKPEINEVNRRKKMFALQIHGSKVSEFIEDKLENFKNSFLLNQKDLAHTIIKGSTAYPGKVTGKAVILPRIFTAEEYEKFIDEFEEGGVLIAPMTSPDLVPVFKKVAAIITDEGGITSHAALIAREMKIPCIVGTSFATKTLKTDMQLLVDATNAEISVI